EGIFIQLRLDAVCEWEKREPVQEQAARLSAKYNRAWHDRGRDDVPVKQLTPRLFLVHSLAHALIRQLSLNCGYGSASLRERLYVGSDNWDMAGLLVFTSSPDADGTLGGLARQGTAPNLVGVFEDCLASMRWCSSDPVCF